MFLIWKKQNDADLSYIFLNFNDIWHFFQNLHFSQMSSTRGMASAVCLIQVRDNLTLQLLFMLIQNEARHLHEIEKGYLVVSFFSVHVKWELLSHVWLFVTPWVIQSMEFSRILEWVAVPSLADLPNPGTELRTQVSFAAGGFFASWATREAMDFQSSWKNEVKTQTKLRICVI